MEMKFLRAVRRVTLLDRMTNEQIRTDINMESTIEYIKRRQLGWWGHMQRMPLSRPVKQVWMLRVQVRRRRGRPRQTWGNIIGQILQERGMSYTQASILAADRTKWKTFINMEKQGV